MILKHFINSTFSWKVYSCTFISATSAKPPTENLQNFLFKARAIERPMLVLPTPGGPERHIILPAIATFQLILVRLQLITEDRQYNREDELLQDKF